MRTTIKHIIAILATALVVTGCTLSGNEEQHIKRKAVVLLKYDNIETDNLNFTRPSPTVRLFLFDNNNILYLDTLFTATSLAQPNVELTYLYDGHYKAVSWSCTDETKYFYNGWMSGLGVSKMSDMYLMSNSDGLGEKHWDFEDIGYNFFEFNIAKGDSIRVTAPLEYRFVGVDVTVTGLDNVVDYKLLSLEYDYLNRIDFAGNPITSVDPVTTIALSAFTQPTTTSTFYTPYESSVASFPISLIYKEHTLSAGNAVAAKTVWTADLGSALADAKANGSHVKLNIDFTKANITFTIEGWGEEVIDNIPFTSED